MAEFTGERVIPGEVEADLWNEHVARYTFAARLSRARRVLDAGCGSGYGAAELAKTAARVIGLDLSALGVGYARKNFSAPNLEFVQASCSSLPLRSASVDLVVCFEVIEHLADWTPFLQEVLRVLAPGGQAIISTPNAEYYGESRGEAGANPYHEHEFTFEEFHRELLKVFPSVSLFLENHVEGIVFSPVEAASAADARVERRGSPKEAHFFVAVCATSPQTGAPTFVYLPRAGNILREREIHIQRLQKEVATKDQWIKELTEELKKLLELFRRQKFSLEQSNRWAEDLNRKLAEAGARIVQLQDELRALAEGYAKRVANLEEENVKKTKWALDLDGQLKRTIEMLHETERRLNDQILSLEAQLNLVRASRWMKLGRKVGLGPQLGDS